MNPSDYGAPVDFNATFYKHTCELVTVILQK